MLRPLVERPIRWTTRNLVWLARRITLNKRPKTLRQALRVLARNGLRRTRLAVELKKELRLKYAMRSMEVMVKHGFELGNVKKGRSTLGQIFAWLQGQPVTIRFGNPQRVHNFKVLFTLETTHLARNVHVELGVSVTRPGILISLFPVMHDTHLRFVDILDQPVDPPQPGNGSITVRVRLGSRVLRGDLGALFVNEFYTDSQNQRAMAIYGAWPLDLPSLRVIFRTLLHLDAGVQDEPSTPTC